MQLSPTQSRKRESRGSKTLWRVKGSALAFPPITTRTQHAVVTNSIARRESRGSKTLWRVKGSALASPSINTRVNYAVVTNSIARRESRGSKTLWQVKGGALAESRGRASGVSPRHKEGGSGWRLDCFGMIGCRLRSMNGKNASFFWEITREISCLSGR